jgi:secernin
MCDTWVALQDATLSRQVILGKNSDRPIFDCQPLVFYPRQQWSPGSRLQLEYAVLPQTLVTYATLGSSPYWCWGYEEGINEHSVVIGNEAIRTKTFRRLAEESARGGAVALGLLGMDLVRLALERSTTAQQAVEVIGALIEAYGQFGSGVPAQTHAAGGYDGSFVIADPREAWIVEAAGKRWVARRITQGTASISNQPSIRTAWNLGSADAAAYAVAQGWWPAALQAEFDFARAYIDERVARQVSQLRAMRSRQLLGEQAGRITPQWMMRIARDHYEDTFLQGPYFDAADPDFHSICMHASAAGFTWGNTASSCVAVLPRAAGELPIFWWTPGPPCNGCYVPFFVHGSCLPAIVSRAGSFGKRVVPADAATEDTFSPESYWWLFRALMDHVKGDPAGSVPGLYPARNRVVRARFDALEQAFAAETPAVMAQALAAQSSAAAAAILDEFTQRCVGQVVTSLRELLDEFAAEPVAAIAPAIAPAVGVRR